MMMNGAELLTVSRILGHKTLNMTLRYAHLSPSYQREALNRLEFFDGNNLVTSALLDAAKTALTRYPSTMPE